METTTRAGRRSVRDEVGDTVKLPIHKTVGQTGECDEAGVLRAVHPDSTEMYNSGDNS